MRSPVCNPKQPLLPSLDISNSQRQLDNSPHPIPHPSPYISPPPAQPTDTENSNAQAAGEQENNQGEEKEEEKDSNHSESTASTNSDTQQQGGNGGDDDDDDQNDKRREAPEPEEEKEEEADEGEEEEEEEDKEEENITTNDISLPEADKSFPPSRSLHPLLSSSPHVTINRRQRFHSSSMDESLRTTMNVRLRKSSESEVKKRSVPIQINVEADSMREISDDGNYALTGDPLQTDIILKSFLPNEITARLMTEIETKMPLEESDKNIPLTIQPEDFNFVPDLLGYVNNELRRHGQRGELNKCFLNHLGAEGSPTIPTNPLNDGNQSPTAVISIGGPQKIILTSKSTPSEINTSIDQQNGVMVILSHYATSQYKNKVQVTKYNDSRGISLVLFEEPSPTNVSTHTSLATPLHTTLLPQKKYICEELCRRVIAQAKDKKVVYELKAHSKDYNGGIATKRQRLLDLITERLIPGSPKISTSLTSYIVQQLDQKAAIEEAKRLNVENRDIPLKDLRVKIIEVLMEEEPLPGDIARTKDTLEEGTPGTDSNKDHTPPKDEGLKPKVPEDYGKDPKLNEKEQATLPEPKDDVPTQSRGSISDSFLMRAVKKVGALAINSELERNGLDQDGTLEERQQRLYDHLSSPHDMNTEADNNIPLTQPKINVSSTASKTETDIFETTLLKVQAEQLTQRKCLDILLRRPNDDVEKDREARLNRLEEQSQAILQQIDSLKDLISNRKNYSDAVATKTPDTTNADAANTNNSTASISTTIRQSEQSPLRQDYRRADTRGRRSIYNRSSPRRERPNSDNTRSRRGARKCLLIHDSHHDCFDRNLFSKDFLVTRHKGASLKNDNHSKIQDLIHKEKPEATIIHLGFNDLTKGQSSETALTNLERLIWTTLENSNTSICIQSVMYTKNDKDLNQKILDYNNEVYKMISQIRKEHSDCQERLFTMGMDSLERISFFKDDGVHMNSDGSKKLMLKLKDSITKALRTTPNNSFNNHPERRRYA